MSDISTQHHQKPKPFLDCIALFDGSVYSIFQGVGFAPCERRKGDDQHKQMRVRLRLRLKLRSRWDWDDHISPNFHVGGSPALNSFAFVDRADPIARAWFLPPSPAAEIWETFYEWRTSRTLSLPQQMSSPSVISLSLSLCHLSVISLSSSSVISLSLSLCHLSVSVSLSSLCLSVIIICHLSVSLSSLCLCLSVISLSLCHLSVIIICHLSVSLSSLCLSISLSSLCLSVIALSQSKCRCWLSTSHLCWFYLMLLLQRARVHHPVVICCCRCCEFTTESRDRETDRHNRDRERQQREREPCFQLVVTSQVPVFGFPLSSWPENCLRLRMCWVFLGRVEVCQSAHPQTQRIVQKEPTTTNNRNESQQTTNRQTDNNNNK